MPHEGHLLSDRLGHKWSTMIFAFLMTFSILVSPFSRPAQAAASTDFSAAIGADPSTLDPSLATDQSAWLVSSQIYETLVTYGSDRSRALPGLAQSWTMSADGKTWTFTLPTGAKFQDGTSLNAQAVLFNFNRWWDPSDPKHIPGGFEIFNALIGVKGPDSLIASMSAPSATQFVVVLSHPASILGILALPPFAIASPAAITAGTLSSHPVGTGPFQFGHWTAGVEIRLDPFLNYYKTISLPTSLTFKVLSSSAEQLAALQNQTVQIAGNLSGTDLTTAQNDATLTVQWRPSRDIGYLGINQAKTPLNKLQVRQAIAHAINKSALLADQQVPGLQAAGQFLPNSIWGYDSALLDYSYDPTLAKSLLTQAGYPNGFPIELAYRSTVRLYLPNALSAANKIASDLAAVGITVTVKEYSSGDFVNQALAGNLELYLLGWTADYLHPDNFFPYHFCNPANLQFGATMDTTLCNLVNSGLTLPTEAQQMAAYQAASDRVFTTLPLIPLFHSSTPLVTRSDLAGLAASPIQAESYRFVFTAQARIYLPLTLR